jgi:hypothetical protein
VSDRFTLDGSKYLTEVLPTSHLPQTPAGRLEMVISLYAPLIEREDGTTYREPRLGLISREQFLRCMNALEDM